MVLTEGKNFHCSKCHASALCHQEMNCFSAALSDKPHCSRVCKHHLRDSDEFSVCKLLKASRFKMSMWLFKNKQPKSSTHKVFWCSFGAKDVCTIPVSL